MADWRTRWSTGTVLTISGACALVLVGAACSGGGTPRVRTTSPGGGRVLGA